MKRIAIVAALVVAGMIGMAGEASAIGRCRGWGRRYERVQRYRLFQPRCGGCCR